MLDGRVVLVTGGGTGIGREISLGLGDLGAAVSTVDGPITSPADAQAAFAAKAHVDAAVHALVDPDALVPTPFADTDEASWDRRCEALLRTALWCCQAAFTVLAERGGRIVLVTPTAGLTGAAGRAPYATAVEGMRSLAKSAARQWRVHGITVNCVAPPVESMIPGVGDAEGDGDVRADVAPVVAMLVADAAHFLTGTTIVVDGGVVMAP